VLEATFGEFPFLTRARSKQQRPSRAEGNLRANDEEKRAAGGGGDAAFFLGPAASNRTLSGSREGAGEQKG